MLRTRLLVSVGVASPITICLTAVSGGAAHAVVRRTQWLGNHLLPERPCTVAQAQQAESRRSPPRSPVTS